MPTINAVLTIVKRDEIAKALRAIPEEGRRAMCTAEYDGFRGTRAFIPVPGRGEQCCACPLGVALVALGSERYYPMTADEVRSVLYAYTAVPIDTDTTWLFNDFMVFWDRKDIKPSDLPAMCGITV